MSKISLQFYDVRVFSGTSYAIIANADRIYLPAVQTEQIMNSADREELIDILSGISAEIFFTLPYINRGDTKKYFLENIDMLSGLAGGFLLQNPGDVNIIKPYKKLIATDYSFNITNSSAANTLNSLAEKSGARIDSICILPELGETDASALGNYFPENITPEIIAGGRYVVMRSEHCFICNVEGYHCGACGKYFLDGGSIRDIQGREYKVTGDMDCRSILLSPAEKANATADDIKNKAAQKNAKMYRFIFS